MLGGAEAVRENEVARDQFVEVGTGGGGFAGWDFEEEAGLAVAETVDLGAQRAVTHEAVAFGAEADATIEGFTVGGAEGGGG